MDSSSFGLVYYNAVFGTPMSLLLESICYTSLWLYYEAIRSCVILHSSAQTLSHDDHGTGKSTEFSSYFLKTGTCFDCDYYFLLTIINFEVLLKFTPNCYICNIFTWYFTHYLTIMFMHYHSVILELMLCWLTKPPKNFWSLATQKASSY